jgi:hypothetical protein
MNRLCAMIADGPLWVQTDNMYSAEFCWGVLEMVSVYF